MRYWTKELIIDELRRVRKDGPKSDSKIDGAARRHFGSLKAALDAAGLPIGKNGVPINRWTEEKIILELCKRATSYSKLRRTQYEDGPLFSSARRTFGSWTKAIEKAGLMSILEDRFFTKEEVQLKIIELYERGIPLQLHSLRDEKLSRSVRKHFCTWGRALKSLGLGSELTRNWTEQTVIEAIQKRWADGFDLAKTRFEDPKLAGAAVYRFGGWVKALEAAGFQGQVHNRMTNEELLDALRSYATNHPSKPITVHNKKLADTARARFGTVDRAFAHANVASGFRPIKPRWSRDTIVLEIQNRVKSGASLSYSDPANRKLAAAGYRLFGSWPKAIEAAGIKPARRHWTRDALLLELQERVKSGGSLSSSDPSNSSLFSGCYRVFGSWRNAVATAGIKPVKRKWSRDAVVIEIQERVKSGTSLRSGDFINRNLVNAGSRYFGSWANALKAAGVTKPKNKKGSNS